MRAHALFWGEGSLMLLVHVPTRGQVDYHYDKPGTGVPGRMIGHFTGEAVVFGKAVHVRLHCATLAEILTVPVSPIVVALCLVNMAALVWADTRELGFAASAVTGVGGSTIIFVCCDYYPAGNVQDPALYRRNVLRP